LNVPGEAAHRRSVTGQACRPDQLFGLWAIEETRFRQYVGLAKGADLAQLRAESMAAAEKASAGPLYPMTSDGIAVIDIAGPMTKYPTSFQALFGGTSTLRTREALRAATRDPDVSAIMLRIDSPGGTVAGGAELAEEIRKAAARKPLHAYADDLAASAGLLALVQARKVWASTNAEVGSIGVYMVVEDTSQVYAQDGVRVHVISSAAPIKGAGVEGTEITPAQLAEWQRRVDDTADWFVNEVSLGRRMPKDAVQKLATGQSWIAEKARGLGLIDGVLSFDEAMSRLRSEVMDEQEKQAAKAETDAALKLAADAEQKALENAARAKAAEDELAAAKAQLATLEAAERGKRFSAEAQALGAPEDFAAVLDKIHAVAGDALYGQLTVQLKAMHAQVAAGKLFEEKGTNGNDPNAGASAATRLEALAAERVKAGTSKSLADAMTTVAAENPDLYRLHVEEQRKGAK
jgi:signal peptide peptidase SppA